MGVWKAGAKISALPARSPNPYVHPNSNPDGNNKLRMVSLAGWLAGWLWLAACLPACLAAWLVVWLASSLAGRHRGSSLIRRQHQAPKMQCAPPPLKHNPRHPRQHPGHPGHPDTTSTQSNTVSIPYSDAPIERPTKPLAERPGPQTQGRGR